MTEKIKLTEAQLQKIKYAKWDAEDAYSKAGQCISIFEDLEVDRDDEFFYIMSNAIAVSHDYLVGVLLEITDLADHVPELYK